MEKRGHEIRVCKAYNRLQSQNHQIYDTYIQTLNLQNQYYKPNPQLEQHNLGQRSQDQRQMLYHATINLKTLRII